MAAWVAGWLVGWMAGWMVGWMAGYISGRMAGGVTAWMAGWFFLSSFFSYNLYCIVTLLCFWYSDCLGFMILGRFLPGPFFESFLGTDG